MNSNMTNIHCNNFSASLENLEQHKQKLCKVWLKNIRGLGIVTHGNANVCFNVRNFI